MNANLDLNSNLLKNVKLGTDLDANVNKITSLGRVEINNNYGVFFKDTGGTYRKSLWIDTGDILWLRASNGNLFISQRSPNTGHKITIETLNSSGVNTTRLRIDNYVDIVDIDILNAVLDLNADADTRLVLPVGIDKYADATPRSGSIWVEGNDLHYIDSSGVERTVTGS